jgi:hypothetical protein
MNYINIKIVNDEYIFDKILRVFSSEYYRKIKYSDETLIDLIKFNLKNDPKIKEACTDKEFEKIKNKIAYLELIPFYHLIFEKMIELKITPNYGITKILFNMFLQHFKLEYIDVFNNLNILSDKVSNDFIPFFKRFKLDYGTLYTISRYMKFN